MKIAKACGANECAAGTAVTDIGSDSIPASRTRSAIGLPMAPTPIIAAFTSLLPAPRRHSLPGPLSDPATDVVLVDQLPDSVVYVSSSGGTYDPVAHAVTFRLGTIPVGGSTTMRPVARSTVGTASSVNGISALPRKLVP